MFRHRYHYLACPSQKQQKKRQGKARHGGVKTAKDSTVSPPLLPSSPISSTVRPSWDPTHHAAPTLCLLFLLPLPSKLGYPVPPRLLLTYTYLPKSHISNSAVQIQFPTQKFNLKQKNKKIVFFKNIFLRDKTWCQKMSGEKFPRVRFPTGNQYLSLSQIPRKNKKKIQ